MTPEDNKIRASRVKQILEDPIFIEAVSALRANKLSELADMDPTNSTAIIQAQSMVRAADDLCSQLMGIYLAAPQERK